MSRNIIVAFKDEENLKKIAKKLKCKTLTNEVSEVDVINKKLTKRNEYIELKSYAQINFTFGDDWNTKKLSDFFEQPINSSVVEIKFPKEVGETRIIKCRFANLNNMKELLEDKFGLEIYKDGKIIKQYNLVTGEVEYKKIPSDTKRKHYTWEDEWKDMPEFNIDFAEEEFAMIEFVCDFNNTNLKGLFEQNITDKTKSIWFPKLIQGKHRKLRVVGGRQPRYPIYVVSKGRYDFKRNTSNFLSRMMIKHYIVVEPQEVELYKQHMDLRYCTVLELDMSYKDRYDRIDEEMSQGFSTGPGAVRNFVRDHSNDNGFKWHWVLDDNIECFDRYWRGHKIYSHSSEIFSTVEDFVDRYKNIGQAGLNYSKFCKGMNKIPPYVTNTRIYSFLLNNNDVVGKEFNWRGTWNEDTILSLDILKAGYCTVQFNQMLGAKITTQKVKGGNTAEFYAKDGTYLKSLMLEKAHPDVAKVEWKFSRWHHEVDYSGFKQELQLKDEYKSLPEETNEHEQIIVRIPEDWIETEKDCREYIEAHLDELERVDNTDIFL